MERRLLKLTEYGSLCKLLSGDGDGVDGINRTEIQHLCWLGAQCPDGGDVVEVGSHRGKSTCCLAAGVRSAGVQGRVFAVDLWTKGAGKTFDHYSSKQTWEIFQRQVRQMGFVGLIRPVQGASVECALRRKRPIHVLFIDASHKYPHVLADWNAWSPFVAPGGWVAFHDYGTRFEGVDRVVTEEVVAHGDVWGEFGVEGRIFTARKIGK